MDKDMDVVGGITVERWVRLPGTIDIRERQWICVKLCCREISNRRGETGGVEGDHGYRTGEIGVDRI